MAIPRSRVATDTLYFERASNCYFITPDGIGCYWFDTLDEVRDQYGDEMADRTPITIQELESF